MVKEGAHGHPWVFVRGQKTFWFLDVLLSGRSIQYSSSPDSLICFHLITIFPNFMACLPSPSVPRYFPPPSSPTKLFFSTLFSVQSYSGGWTVSYTACGCCSIHVLCWDEGGWSLQLLHGLGGREGWKLWVPKLDYPPLSLKNNTVIVSALIFAAGQLGGGRPQTPVLTKAHVCQRQRQDTKVV